MRARNPAETRAPLPGWLTEADVDFYAAEFARTGFRGGLNWYRNIDRNWELLAPFAGAKVTVPALYVAGERDLVLAFPGAAEMVANLVYGRAEDCGRRSCCRGAGIGPSRNGRSK